MSVRVQITLSPLFIDYLGRQQSKKGIGKLKVNLISVKQFANRSVFIGKKGFKIGMYIGSVIGFGIGCSQAYQMRQLKVIPLCTIGSGVVFGSIYCLSSIIKNSAQLRAKI